MSNLFKSGALQSTYAGDYSGAPDELTPLLYVFRTGGSNEQDAAIAALDSRIAAFESILIGSLPAGQTSAVYPYDRTGLSTEFHEDLMTLLFSRGYQAPGVIVARSSTNFPSDVQNVLAGEARTGFGNFSTLTYEQRRDLLHYSGQQIFDLYSRLINDVFAEGDKLGNNPPTPVQVTATIPALTVGSVTYNRLAQVQGVDPSTGQPTTATYLLDSTAVNGKVSKNAEGDVVVGGVANAQAYRLRLIPELTELTSNPGDPAVWVVTSSVTSPGRQLKVRFPAPAGSPPTLEDTAAGLTATAVPTAPIVLNVPGREAAFPEESITSSYRVTLNGASYLLGLSTEGSVYITGLTDSRRQQVNQTVGLSPTEYLLYWNEARIKILRAKLAYNEAVVREIQEDLRNANKALAQLEVQAGRIQATNSDGSPTNQLSVETLDMSLFSATAGTPSQRIFDATGGDSLHSATEWQKNRTNLKNYIDRRSAEAQQATLDYQNMLNRYNNAFEVMAKLQEKLDALLKAQLRNV
jgi:hypothetical protein